MPRRTACCRKRSVARGRSNNFSVNSSALNFLFEIDSSEDSTMLVRSFAPSLLWSSSVLSLIAFACPSCDATQPKWPEAELLAVLASDAADADKALACKRLAVSGSADATAPLGKLLDSPQLSSWARIALEVIPDSSADNQLITRPQSRDRK